MHKQSNYKRKATPLTIFFCPVSYFCNLLFRVEFIFNYVINTDIKMTGGDVNYTKFSALLYGVVGNAGPKGDCVDEF